MGALTALVKAKGRSPVVSGLFYPEDRTGMNARLRSFGLESGVGGKASAIIAPHGAWELSGAVAAKAFQAAAGRAAEISRVVILGNIHRVEEPGVFFTDSHFFETPLGKLPVDQEISESLTSCSTLFAVNDFPHLQETSVEVLLPLAQFCFPAAAIVPILMGGSQPRLIAALARAMRIILEPLMDSVLLVVSSNLSIHNDPQMARTEAETSIRLLEENRTDELISGIHAGRISSCGGALIASLLESGLLAGKTPRLVSGPLVTAQGELGNTTCYAGIAFD